MTTAANTYAKAFLDVPGSDAVLPVVKALAPVLGKNAEMLGDPRLGPAERAKLVKEVSRQLKLPALLANLLILLAENKRLGEAGEVLEAIIHLANQRAKVAEVRVESASPFTAEQLSGLKALLKKKLNAADVLVEEVKNPGLIGGFRAFMAGSVWDCSLKGRLDTLAAQFNHVIHR